MSHPSDGHLNRPHDVAEALRRLADDLAAMPDDELPVMAVSVSIQFCSWTATADEQRQAAVDAVAKQVLGEPGQPREMLDGGWQHGTPHDQRERRGDGIRVGVFTAIGRPGGEP